MSKKAVVLLSGGLDSSTVLYWAKKKGYKAYCLIFNYGQRHSKELRSAVKLAKLNKCPCKIVKVKLSWDKSSLTDKTVKIPVKLNRIKSKLPSTYVPGRNTLFISYALSYAETIKASKIFIGANAVDYSGYPDCRPIYYKAWNNLFKSLDLEINIEAPLINLSKESIIRLGYKLKVPYDLTWSCYKGGRVPCGVCDSCRFRIDGFRKAGRK